MDDLCVKGGDQLPLRETKRMMTTKIAINRLKATMPPR